MCSEEDVRQDPQEPIRKAPAPAPPHSPNPILQPQPTPIAPAPPHSPTPTLHPTPVLCAHLVLELFFLVLGLKQCEHVMNEKLLPNYSVFYKEISFKTKACCAAQACLALNPSPPSGVRTLCHDTQLLDQMLPPHKTPLALQK